MWKKNPEPKTPKPKFNPPPQRPGGVRMTHTERPPSPIPKTEKEIPMPECKTPKEDIGCILPKSFQDSLMKELERPNILNKLSDKTKHIEATQGEIQVDTAELSKAIKDIVDDIKIECLAMSIVNYTNEINGVDSETRQKNNSKCCDYAIKRIKEFRRDVNG